jgi:hypothetical protein
MSSIKSFSVRHQNNMASIIACLDLIMIVNKQPNTRPANPNTTTCMDGYTLATMFSATLDEMQCLHDRPPASQQQCYARHRFKPVICS